jgi:MFS family permease
MAHRHPCLSVRIRHASGSVFVRRIMVTITELATGSSMMAPALPQISERLHITNPTITALTLSIFLLTFSFGPLLFAPLSECYGRTWVRSVSGLP